MREVGLKMMIKEFFFGVRKGLIKVSINNFD